MEVTKMMIANFKIWKIGRKRDFYFSKREYKTDVERAKRRIEEAKEELKKIRAKKPKLNLNRKEYEKYVQDGKYHAQREGLVIEFYDKEEWWN